MGTTVYIAGNTLGLPQDQVKEKFSRVISDLSQQGYVVVSPVSLYNQTPNWQDGARDDIKTMLECDELTLLPCWQESQSAQLKRDIAIRLGMNVTYL